MQIITIFFLGFGQRVHPADNQDFLQEDDCGKVPGRTIVTLLCAVVCEELCWKRIKCVVKKKETVTTQMFNVLHF